MSKTADSKKSVRTKTDVTANAWAIMMKGLIISAKSSMRCGRKIVAESPAPFPSEVVVSDGSENNFTCIMRFMTNSETRPHRKVKMPMSTGVPE